MLYKIFSQRNKLGPDFLLLHAVKFDNLYPLAALALFSVWMSFPGKAEAVDREFEAKVTSQIINRSQAGTVQDLYIYIETSDVDAEIEALRIARGLSFEDNTLLEQRSKRYNEIKGSILLSSGVAPVLLIENFNALPMFKIRVFDERLLTKLLMNPKVSSIKEPRRMTLQ